MTWVRTNCRERAKRQGGQNCAVGGGQFSVDIPIPEKDFLKISSMITLIGDDSGFAFVAEDESGNQYNYEKEGFSNERPDNRAIDWLGVKPDYYD